MYLMSLLTYTLFQTVILIASLIKQCLSPAEYPSYVGCDPSNPTSSKEWIKDIPFTWWAQIAGAVMVMLPVVPMPLFAAWHVVKTRFLNKGSDQCINVA